jgi:hypothetical protein
MPKIRVPKVLVHYAKREIGPYDGIEIVIVNGNDVALDSVGRIYPKDEAALDLLLTRANANLDLQWSLTHYHDVDEFYQDG